MSFVKVNPSLISSDSSDWTSAAGSLLTAASTAASGLAGVNGMAGDDNVAEEFAPSYDEAMGKLLKAATDVASLMYNIDGALESTAYAYRAIESVGSGESVREPIQARPRVIAIPSGLTALGPGWPGPLGEFQEMLEGALALIGVTIPTGDPDKCDQAASVWTEFGSAWRSAQSTISGSCSSISSMQLPSSHGSSILSVRASTARICGEVASSCGEMSTASSEMAKGIRQMREQLTAFIAQMVAEVLIEVGISLALSFLTGGLAAIAGSAKVGLTVAKWARKIADLIMDLRAWAAAQSRLARLALTALREGLTAAAAAAITTPVFNAIYADASWYQQQNVLESMASAFVGGSAGGMIPGGLTSRINNISVRNITQGAASGVVDGLASSTTQFALDGFQGDFNPLGAMVLGGMMGGGMGGMSRPMTAMNSGAANAGANFAANTSINTPDGTSITVNIGEDGAPIQVNFNGANFTPSASSGATSTTTSSGTTVTVEVGVPSSGTPGAPSTPQGGGGINVDSNAPTPSGNGGGTPTPQGGGTPDISGIDAPSNPGTLPGDSVSSPDISAPSTPDVSTPSTPDVSTPSTPDVSAPTTPDVSTPSTPDVSTPTTPDVSAPSSPDVSAPSTPDVSTPSTPDVSAPTTPDVSTPSTPDVSAPSTPDVSAPSSPDVAASRPDMDSSTTNVDTLDAPNVTEAPSSGVPVNVSQAPSSAEGTGEGANVSETTHDTADSPFDSVLGDLAPTTVFGGEGVSTPESDAPASDSAPAEGAESTLDVDAMEAAAGIAVAGVAAVGVVGVGATATTTTTVPSQSAAPAPRVTTPEGPQAPSGPDGGTPDAGPDAPSTPPADGPGNDSTTSKEPKPPRELSPIEVRERTQEALDAANPGYTGDPTHPRSNNCGATSVAMAEAFNSGTPHAAGEHTHSIAEMATELGRPQVTTTPEAIADAMIARGEPSMEVVGIDRADGEDGHWFNVMFDGSDVYYVDGQTGEMSAWPPTGLGNVTAWDASIPQTEIDAVTTQAPATPTPVPPQTSPDASPIADSTTNQDGTDGAPDRSAARPRPPQTSRLENFGLELSQIPQVPEESAPGPDHSYLLDQGLLDIDGEGRLVASDPIVLDWIDRNADTSSLLDELASQESNANGYSIRQIIENRANYLFYGRNVITSSTSDFARNFRSEQVDARVQELLPPANAGLTPEQYSQAVASAYEQARAEISHLDAAHGLDGIGGGDVSHIEGLRPSDANREVGRQWQQRGPEMDTQVLQVLDQIAQELGYSRAEDVPASVWESIHLSFVFNLITEY